MPDKNKIILGTNDDTYIAADDAGNIVLQHEQGQRVALTDSAIEPATDETLDLGSATKKFKDLYLSSDSIYIGNTKLSSDPTTGALSTVVADEQGQFTAPAAPVGGSAGSYDWEATGFTHFSPFLTTNYPSGYNFEKINQLGTDTNFWDPIALWNHTRGANPILNPAQHINGSKWGTANSSDFSPAAAQNFRWQELGIIDDFNAYPNFWQYGADIGDHQFWLTSPDEFDVHRSNNNQIATLFKDANDEYFKDFLSKKMDEHSLMDLTVQLECDVVYTCSDAATAAATPFF